MSSDMKSLLAQMVERIDRDQLRAIGDQAGIEGEKFYRFSIQCCDGPIESLCLDDSGTPVVCPGLSSELC